MCIEKKKKLCSAVGSYDDYVFVVVEHENKTMTLHCAEGVLHFEYCSTLAQLKLALIVPHEMDGSSLSKPYLKTTQKSAVIKGL